ncbi:hypothetical protein BIW11_05561 [Tropilaelaps mercedesae]|uniref:Uncharacterized protein n=1 Tax=Tropilaelaps mercedesae TaxID=418985 RepID=A0A1V9Y1X2_9ACAR|nr:hypothetical protein BIW11_05561 [Tropilaelaps mercedesae]
MAKYRSYSDDKPLAFAFILVCLNFTEPTVMTNYDGRKGIYTLKRIYFYVSWLDFVSSWLDVSFDFVSPTLRGIYC